MGCDLPKAFNSTVNFPIVRHVSPTTKHTDTTQVICSPPLVGSLSAKQAEMTSSQRGNQSSLSHGRCQRISMLLSVATWCERSHLKQYVWLQKLQQFRRCNDNVLCYMLFLKIGAHSPLQSNEPKPQTKQTDHVLCYMLFLKIGARSPLQSNEPKPQTKQTDHVLCYKCTFSKLEHIAHCKAMNQNHRPNKQTMYSVTCSFSKLEHTAHCKAMNQNHRPNKQAMCRKRLFLTVLYVLLYR